MFRCKMSLKKKSRSDRPRYGHWRYLISYGHWRYLISYGHWRIKHINASHITNMYHVSCGPSLMVNEGCIMTMRTTLFGISRWLLLLSVAYTSHPVISSCSCKGGYSIFAKQAGNTKMRTFALFLRKMNKLMKQQWNNHYRLFAIRHKFVSVLCLQTEDEKTANTIPVRGVCQTVTGECGCHLFS